MKVRDRHEGQLAKCSSLTIARYAKHGIWPRWTRKCIRVSRNTPAVGAVPVSKSLGKEIYEIPQVKLKVDQCESIDPLHPVTALAKQLQVLQAAAATHGVWNYVMEFQILR